MKKTMMVLTGALVLAFFANCGKNDDGPKGGAVEMSGACYNMSRMNTQNGWGTQVQQPYGAACSYPYTSAVNSGMTNASSASAFGYMTGSSFGSSMCSGSQSQAYSPTKGLACVQNTQITLSGQPVVYDLNPMTGNFAPISTPIPNFAYQSQLQGQYGNQFGYGQQTYPYGATTGMSSSYMPTSQTQVYRVCDATEACPTNQICRSALGPYSGGGALGICYF